MSTKALLFLFIQVIVLYLFINMAFHLNMFERHRFVQIKNRIAHSIKNDPKISLDKVQRIYGSIYSSDKLGLKYVELSDIYIPTVVDFDVSFISMMIELDYDAWKVVNKGKLTAKHRKYIFTLSRLRKEYFVFGG